MIYAKLDVRIGLHPKLRSVSYRARWLYLAAIGWSRDYLTDGHVPPYVPTTLVEDQALDAAGELVTVGLWHENGDGWHIHDYLSHQESAETVRKRQDAARTAADARWGRQDRQDRQDASGAMSEPASVPGSVPASAPDPAPREAQHPPSDPLCDPHSDAQTSPPPPPKGSVEPEGSTSAAAATRRDVLLVIATLERIDKPGYQPPKLTADRIARVLDDHCPAGVDAALEARDLADWETYGGGARQQTKDGVARLRRWLAKATPRTNGEPLSATQRRNAAQQRALAGLLGDHPGADVITLQLPEAS